MITPEPRRVRVEYSDELGPVVSKSAVPAAGHLGVLEERCDAAHWPLEHAPNRHCGGCGGAV